MKKIVLKSNRKFCFLLKGFVGKRFKGNLGFIFFVYIEMLFAIFTVEIVKIYLRGRLANTACRGKYCGGYFLLVHNIFLFRLFVRFFILFNRFVITHIVTRSWSILNIFSINSLVMFWRFLDFTLLILWRLNILCRILYVFINFIYILIGCLQNKKRTFIVLI